MVEPTYDYDVAIVGAGPAGAHTAIRLGNLGLRVALLDAKTFPRSKPCGEFLSPACLPLLEETGLLKTLLSSPVALVDGMRVGNGERTIGGRYKSFGIYSASHGYGIGVRRELLDTQAVEAARALPNIDVLLGWRFSELILSEDRRVGGVVALDPSGEHVASAHA